MKLNVISARVPAGAETYKPEMTRTAVDVMLASHPLLPLVEFHDIIGDAEYVENNQNITGGAGRVKGTDFSAANAARDYQAPALKIFGDAKTIDQAEQRRGKNMNDFAQRVLTSLSRNAGLNFANKLVHGATSTSMWDGIAVLCAASQKLALATNGAVIPLGNSDANRALQQAFFEALDTIIGYVTGGVSALLVNSKLHARITNVYREAFTYVVTDATVGVPVPRYNGIPFVPMGYDASGNENLPFTETQGTGGSASTTCSSIYAVSFAEADQLSVASNTGVNVYFSKSGEKYRINPEGDFVPTLFSTKAIAALTGIKLS